MFAYTRYSNRAAPLESRRALFCLRRGGSYCTSGLKWGLLLQPQQFVALQLNNIPANGLSSAQLLFQRRIVDSAKNFRYQVLFYAGKRYTQVFAAKGYRAYTVLFEQLAA